MAQALKTEIHFEDIDATRSPKERARRARQQGYDDGFARREKKTNDPLYSEGYRRGVEARENEGL
jgi:hypothetical protein